MIARTDASISGVFTSASESSADGGNNAMHSNAPIYYQGIVLSPTKVANALPKPVCVGGSSATDLQAKSLLQYKQKQAEDMSSAQKQFDLQFKNQEKRQRQEIQQLRERLLKENEKVKLNEPTVSLRSAFYIADGKLCLDKASLKNIPTRGVDEWSGKTSTEIVPPRIAAAEKIIVKKRIMPFWALWRQRLQHQHFFQQKTKLVHQICCRFITRLSWHHWKLLMMRRRAVQGQCRRLQLRTLFRVWRDISCKSKIEKCEQFLREKIMERHKNTPADRQGLVHSETLADNPLADFSVIIRDVDSSNNMLNSPRRRRGPPLSLHAHVNTPTESASPASALVKIVETPAFEYPRKRANDAGKLRTMYLKQEQIDHTLVQENSRNRAELGMDPNSQCVGTKTALYASTSRLRTQSSEPLLVRLIRPACALQRWHQWCITRFTAQSLLQAAATHRVVYQMSLWFRLLRKDIEVRDFVEYARELPSQSQAALRRCLSRWYRRTYSTIRQKQVNLKVHRAAELTKLYSAVRVWLSFNANQKLLRLQSKTITAGHLGYMGKQIDSRIPRNRPFGGDRLQDSDRVLQTLDKVDRFAIMCGYSSNFANNNHTRYQMKLGITRWLDFMRVSIKQDQTLRAVVKADIYYITPIAVRCLAEWQNRCDNIMWVHSVSVIAYVLKHGLHRFHSLSYNYKLLRAPSNIH